MAKKPISKKTATSKGVGPPPGMVRLTINVWAEKVDALRRHQQTTGVPVAFQVRRLIDNFLAEQAAAQGNPTMAVAPNPVSPHRSVDARGRVIPRTEDEQRRHAEGAIRALDSLDEIGDEEEQRATLEALIKGLDEDGDRLSDRKRFR